jgi:hypothetical protein
MISYDQATIEYAFLGALIIALPFVLAINLDLFPRAGDLLKPCGWFIARAVLAILVIGTVVNELRGCSHGARPTADEIWQRR